jgi:hypothetical protein
VNGDLSINKGMSLVPCRGCGGVVGGGVTPDDGGDMAEVDAEGVDVDGVLYRRWPPRSLKGMTLVILTLRGSPEVADGLLDAAVFLFLGT